MAYKASLETGLKFVSRFASNTDQQIFSLMPIRGQQPFQIKGNFGERARSYEALVTGRLYEAVCTITAHLSTEVRRVPGVRECPRRPGEDEARAAALQS